jgi:hypothetical protein
LLCDYIEDALLIGNNTEIKPGPGTLARQLRSCCTAGLDYTLESRALDSSAVITVHPRDIFIRPMSLPIDKL